MDLMAKPQDFWTQRAQKQLMATSYRLVYRMFFYEENSGKGLLPLPPVELWNIEFTSEPEIRTIDGHELLVRDYKFTSTLLSAEDQALISDSALDAPGKSVVEDFVLPVDPEHILERTGYACMDEADFPPNSVDTENATNFYDDYCEAEILVEDGGCHLTAPIPTESCVEAVQAHIGSLSTSFRFERLAWDDALADSVRVGSQLPGIIELRAMPEGVEDNRIVYRYFPEDSCAIAEGCVGGPGWRRLLQFTATVQNLGAVDSAIGDVGPGSPPVENRLVSPSACHGHMHFNHYGTFAFGDGDQQLGGKRAFCLESTWRYFNNEDTPLTHPYGCYFQGTAAGWGDDYIAGLDCQWVDVTPIDTTAAPVDSTLTFHVNPDKFLCEGTKKTDDNGNDVYEVTEFTNEDGEFESKMGCDETPNAADNNIASAPVTLPEGTGGLITEPCERGQIGPKRNCGFAPPSGEITCTPGATTTITCTGATADEPIAVRVCESSSVLGAIPCTFRDALAVATQDTPSVDLTFTCPAARSATLGENGGSVGVFTGALVSGSTSAVTCSLK
jgi:hypothetical protein